MKIEYHPFKPHSLRIPELMDTFVPSKKRFPNQKRQEIMVRLV